jgi:structural maintenance of chromosome 1
VGWQSLQRQKADLEKLVPQQIKQAAVVKNLKKKITDDERSIEKIRKDESELNDRVEGIKDDIGQLEDEEASLDKSAQDARDKTGKHLDKEKSAEYDILKADAQKQTAADRSQLASLQSQQTSDQNSATQSDNDHAELKTKLESDSNRLQKLKDRFKSINSATEAARSECRGVEKALQELQSKEVNDSKKRVELEKELEDVQARLREVKDDRHQSKQEEKMAQCLDTLKRLFPGVRGRLMDLCKPVQRKYDTAVTVAAGRHMDAIVVDTQETGYECIQYMREHRIGVASFIPLNGIKTKEVNDRLRSLGPKCRLCIDVIQCTPQEIYPAVVYAVENTVVCESLDAARDLCFKRNEKVKAVTLDGTVISKAGTMTGGNAPRDAGKGSRWDAQEHSNLKLRRNDILSEVGKLDTSRHDQGRMTELKTKITQLKSKEEYATKDMAVTKEKIAGLQKQIEELKKQLGRVVEDQSKLPPRIADREKSITAVQQRISSTEEKVFSEFSKSIGVTNIREFEEGQLQVLRTTADRRRKLREQKAKLEAQLQFEQTKDFSSPLKKIEKRITQTKTQLAQGDEKQRALADSEKSATDEVRACEEKRDETKGALEENEVEVKALQSERSECSKERVAVTKKITAEETTVEQLRGKLHTVLQKAKVEEVDLPMVGGTSSIADGTSSESGSQAGSQSSETTASTHFSQKDNQQVRRDQTDAERVDFSELENHRDVEPSKLPKIKNDYESKLTELQGEIQQMQPNMKVGSTVCNREIQS